MERIIATIAEHAEGAISPATFETAAAGVRIREIVGGRIVLVVLGDRLGELARSLHEMTGDFVRAIEVPGLTSYNGEVYRKVLSQVLSDLGADFVCAANSSQSMDFVPGLAVGLNAACITGVEDIDRDGESLCFSRGIIGGKVIARMATDAPVTVLTIQSGCFRPTTRPQRPQDCSGPPSAPDEAVVIDKVEYVAGRSRSLGLKTSQVADAGLADARVIVAAGRGARTKEGVEKVRQLTTIFPSAAFAASRPLCDLGWVEYSRQVGVTGTTVAPGLYLACGISGAMQHVLGMRGSGFVAAINNDANAAIFREADVCIVEDLSTFIPVLIDVWQKQVSTDRPKSQ